MLRQAPPLKTLQNERANDPACFEEGTADRGGTIQQTIAVMADSISSPSHLSPSPSWFDALSP